ncbi:MAG: hypothetical protein QG657_519 [Acidobacteriota bacterium]|nr:hypothetical protein [Acidobacteriota bacterium]
MENTALCDRINSLPSQVKVEVLDFMEFLMDKIKKQDTKSKNAAELNLFPQRRLGLLDGKASFRIRDDFEMTDEELLSV